MVLPIAEIQRWLATICQRNQEYTLEATLISSHEVTLRYAMNRIHQNLEEDQIYLSIRVLKDGHTGEASTNQIDLETIDRLLEQAISNSKLSSHTDTTIGFTADNEMQPSPKGMSAMPAAESLDRMMDCVEQAIQRAEQSGLEAAGVLSCIQRRIGFGTSAGCQAISDYSSSHMNVMLYDGIEIKSSWASKVAARLENLDASRLVDEALQKVSTPKHMRQLPAGKYPAILDFYATAEIMSLLASNCFSGSEFQQEGKVSADHLGEQLFHESVNLWDDGCDGSGCPTWYDYEGILKQRIPLIEGGRLVGAVYDRETAAKYGIESSGHAQSPRQLFAAGPQANNLFMQAGQLDNDALLRCIGTGLWITRFQYTTLSDPSELVISGTTRDGTFWVEDGIIQHALPNLKFHVSILRLLKEIPGMSNEVRLLESDFGVIQTPCWVVKEFNIL